MSVCVLLGVCLPQFGNYWSTLLMQAQWAEAVLHMLHFWFTV